MPQYAYRAIDRNSQVSTGVMVADSESLLETRMADLGLWLIEANPYTSKQRSTRKVRVERKVLAEFFNNLAALLNAGVDIAGALQVLTAECEDPGLREVLEDVHLSIQSGVGVHQAMAAHPSVFSDELVNLVRAGEHSGQLETTCADISAHLEWLDQLVGDIKQATIYPIMLCIAVFGLIFLMFAFVVPQFAEIFDSLNMELPGLTQAVVHIGAFLNGYWWLVLLAMGGLIATLLWLPGHSPEFATFLDRLKLNAPLFGPINRLLVLSRFTHNMALLLKAGVPIIDSLNLVTRVVQNRIMGTALAQAELAVTDGRKISEALAEHEIISPIVMRMIVVGEETGRLDVCLEKISERMDREIPRRIKKLFSIIEPMIVLSLIAIVAVVAGAIFMPLFGLMSGLRG